MEIEQLRRAFNDFFISKGYNLKPASPIYSEEDPSVLFTTAGMQQFKDYYLKPELAETKKVVTIQPVIRTSDIDEVGDDTHLTTFEMLGNFWFGCSGSYQMKEAAIKEAWQFMTEQLKVAKNRISVTVFAGDDQTPADEQSARIWASYAVPIKKADRADNFWGPTGSTGPCGPTSEIYVDGIEVWNLVFNEFNFDGQRYQPLAKPGLDTGAGLERLAATLQAKKSLWQIEPLAGWLEKLSLSGNDGRIIIDHLRAIIFIASAGIEPGNKGREYVLRRLIRKSIFLANRHKLSDQLLIELKTAMTKYYGQFYQLDPTRIAAAYKNEREQFSHNLHRAVSYLENYLARKTSSNITETTELAFRLVESFGFPKEMAFEYLIAQDRSVDKDYFDKLFAEHQSVSRHGSDKQFKSGLADHNEQTIKHHTASHLLLAALRHVLGPDVHQRGSNVTSERLRLDFSFDRPLTVEEKKQVENLVNQKIKEDLPVTVEELTKEEALATGALAEFGNKYAEKVTIYSIGDFSKEFCAGPHVSHTGVLGKFAILKEIASSRGVRRIKARTT